MRSVQIYIEGERDSNDYSEVELFDDEKISINLSVQNIQDISKVFTDFSQSFTVPASAVNNSIFKHFYENAIDLDVTLIDQRLRRNAFIEIDRTPFRSGKIQLEKANLKDGQAESYTITFYGDLVTLKDLFSDDKLSDLDYSNVSNPYSYNDVKDRITDGATDYDVRYPLISSSKLWSYGDSTSTDISITAGAINYRDLFPAVKVAKIFESIENKYNINFNGIFLSDKRFTDLFLWCKNALTTTESLQNQSIDFVSDGGFNYKFQVDLSNDSMRLLYGGEVPYKYDSDVFLTCYYVSDVNAEWTVDVFVNGVLWQTQTRTGLGQFLAYGERTRPSTDATITFRVRSNETIDIQFIVDWQLKDWFTGVIAESMSVDGAVQTINDSIDLSLSMPDIKVSDFFTGILNQFNLTCYPLGVNTFEIEPLDNWYQKGAITDVTSYVDIDSIDVSRVPLYKRVSFEYKESKSYLNEEFYGNNRRYYGDLTRGFEFDGSEFKVNVPFENLVHRQITTDLQVGYSLTAKPDYKSYIPKPILLYMYNQTTVPYFKLTDSITTTDNLTTYMPFGQDLMSNGVNYSLNFGKEISSLLLNDSPFSIYEIYYDGYLSNLFNPKNRLTNIKATLPTSLITSLELNDRLIIRDKRYIINNLRTDLTTGEVDLELIHDFREILNENPLTIGSGSGSITVPILVGNGVNDVQVTTASTGVTLGATTNFTSDGFVEVNYSANPNQIDYRITEDGSQRVTEKFYDRRSENGENFIVELDLESTYINGDVTNEQIYIIQEA